MKNIEAVQERDRITELLKAHYPTLHRRYQIKAIGLFGSIAKGSQNRDSDADIYVEFERKSFRNVAGALTYLQRLLGRDVDLVYPHKNANSAIIETIRKETRWIIPPKSC